MKVKLIGGLALATACAATSVGSAATLYSDNFNANTSANYTVNAGPGTNPVTFAYDYSAVGVPPAPGNSDTLGLRLQANTTTPPTGTTITGVSVQPTGQSFTGDYRVRFHQWMNTIGPFPGGGAGSTELTLAGIGATDTNSQRPGGNIDGVLFGATGDGGSGSDYRAYPPGASGSQFSLASGVYAAGTGATAQNNTDPYYAAFGSLTPPAAQTALFPSTQTGTTQAGTQAFSWQLVEISKIGNIVAYNIGGVRIATVDLVAQNVTLGGSNIALAQSDINGTIATGDTNALLVFGLIDNLVVEQIVPEPTSLGALALTGLLLRRRR